MFCEIHCYCYKRVMKLIYTKWRQLPRKWTTMGVKYIRHCPGSGYVSKRRIFGDSYPDPASASYITSSSKKGHLWTTLLAISGKNKRGRGHKAGTVKKEKLESKWRQMPRKWRTKGVRYMRHCSGFGSICKIRILGDSYPDHTFWA